MTREPYTEPYTRRERLSIRRDLLTYDVRQFFREGIWVKLAWMLPHELAKWAFVRVSANVTDVPPDQITYTVAAKAWDAKRVKPVEST